MLLSAVIIILREVLELALLTSILLAVGKQIQLSTHWFFYSLAGGLAGAAIYALNTKTVSEWFEYTGQEVFNGTSQLLIFIFLASLVFICHFHKTRIHKFVPLLMALSVALLITREGSEIYIYLTAFDAQSQHLSSVLAGCIIGSAIGLSIGALVYYLLSYREDRARSVVSMVFLAVIASGILSQAVPMFMQADIIDSQTPLWDSSFLLSEQSLVGQLIYAIAGYESTPSPLQFACNVLGLLLILVLAFVPTTLFRKGRQYE